MNARDSLIDLAGYKYTPEKYERKGQELYDRIAAEVRAETLREAADAIDAETELAKGVGVLEPDKFRPCRDAPSQLRRMAEEEK